MLAFNHLGQLGRFGNQMFQYASLKGIARNRGLNYCIPNNLDSIEFSRISIQYLDVFICLVKPDFVDNSVLQ